MPWRGAWHSSTTQGSLDLFVWIRRDTPLAARVVDPLSRLHLNVRYKRPIFSKARYGFQWREDYLRARYGTRLFAERNDRWGFHPDSRSLPDDVCLYGYFQSEENFESIAPIIREDLRLEHLSGPAPMSRVEERIRASNAVALHMRRGDYMTSPR